MTVTWQSGNARFDYCIPIILEDEGGLVDNPLDPGGVTNYGISQASYPNVDIRNLTEDQAAVIYYSYYWMKNRCNELPPHLDLWYFTACIMSGGGTAAKILQQILGVHIDGIIGPATLYALPKFTNYVTFLTMYTGHLITLKDWPTFGKGWLNRMFRIAAL